jgi:hypothetical protein
MRKPRRMRRKFGENSIDDKVCNFTLRHAGRAASALVQLAEKYISISHTRSNIRQTICNQAVSSRLRLRCCQINECKHLGAYNYLLNETLSVCHLMDS